MGGAAALMSGLALLPQPPGFDTPKLVPSTAFLAIGSLAFAGIVAGLYPARKQLCCSPWRRSAKNKRMMKRDLMQQAYGAMRHDMQKTVLTMLGMAWGIATVVLLLAYGEGFGTAIQNIFESFRRQSSRRFSGTNFAAGRRKQSRGADSLYG